MKLFFISLKIYLKTKFLNGNVFLICRDKAKRLAFQEGFETRKKQSLISRKPNGLENINEDIESQSRSGNFNLTNERQSPENYQAMEDSYRSHRNDYVRDRPLTKGLGEVDPRKTPQNCRLQNKNFETPERCPRKNNGQNETISNFIFILQIIFISF